MPQGVAGPPYHYRCRTTTVAYFEELEGDPLADDTYQYFDGSKTRKEKIVYRHYDRELGRELVLTEGGLEHVLRKHPEMTKEKVIAGLRSIKQFGESKDYKGQMATLSENNVFMAFRDNAIYTAFVPKDRQGRIIAKAYFNSHTDGRFKKWAEQLRHIFAQLFTR